MAPPEFEPGPYEGEELTIKGDLETSSVPELLRSLLASRETGVLTFNRGDLMKTVYIREGRVIYGTSNDPDERLGESLLMRGKITARQYLQASNMIRPERRLGAILVEMEAVDPEELVPAVEQHVRDILLDLICWNRGDYELVVKDVDPRDVELANVVTLNLSTENLILEGIRQCRAWSQVLRGIGGDIGVVPSQTDNSEMLYKLELTSEEQEVLAQVNGRSSVEQICQVSYLPDFETCRILWSLMVLGVIRREKGAQPRPAPEGAAEGEGELDLEDVVERFNQMFGRIYSFLEGRLGAGVDEFMDAAMEQVCRQYGKLFDGVDLRAYGRADFEQMLANVADLPAEQRKSLMVSGLNELVFVIQLNVRTRYGAQEAAVISGIIKEGFRKLGVA
jgi:uncharacterized protein DUF4388